MPLPDASIPWPPRNMIPVLGKLRTWDAWYCGDPEALSEMYGAWGYNPRDAMSPYDRYGMLLQRPAQYRGGVIGRIARWFWGTPTPPGERPSKLHVPIAGDIAATSADLMFGEAPKLTVDDVKTSEQLEDLVAGGLHASLLEAAEFSAAHGGVYLRIAWDRSVADRPWMVPAPADSAIPEWTWDKLSAVTFWEVLEQPSSVNANTTVLRHLERHEPGFIYHGLYEGTPDLLGRPIPLTEHPATRALAGIVDEQSAIATGVPKLTVVYVPNMRPNRTWRSDAAATNLGRSDFAGVEPLMDALDETYTAWMRDVRLGKARLLVPDSFLQNLGQGKGAFFDAEQEVFTGLNMLPTPDGKGNLITPNQFAIRWQEHKSTADELFAAIIRDAGYSMQTFGDAADVRGVTATEITARERKTMTTRGRKIGYWRPRLADLVETLLAVWQQIEPSARVEPAVPLLEWPGAVQPPPEDRAQTIQLLHAAEAVSRETAVRMFNPDWTDEQVQEEVDRIVAEMPAMPEPGHFGGSGLIPGFTGEGHAAPLSPDASGSGAGPSFGG